MMPAKKFAIAVFIGRFQPFHNGHLYSLRKALEIADRAIVGIGSVQEEGTENNPWGFELRKEMILKTAQDEGILIQAIEPIPDFPNDKDWAECVTTLIAKNGYLNTQAVIVGNNDWTNSVMRAHGVAVYETGLQNRDELEGEKIRRMMRKGDTGWIKRVPTAVAEILK